MPKITGTITYPGTSPLKLPASGIAAAFPEQLDGKPVSPSLRIGPVIAPIGDGGVVSIEVPAVAGVQWMVVANPPTSDLPWHVGTWIVERDVTIGTTPKVKRASAPSPDSLVEMLDLPSAHSAGQLAGGGGSAALPERLTGYQPLSVIVGDLDEALETGIFNVAPLTGPVVNSPHFDGSPEFGVNSGTVIVQTSNLAAAYGVDFPFLHVAQVFVTGAEVAGGNGQMWYRFGSVAPTNPAVDPYFSDWVKIGGSGAGGEAMDTYTRRIVSTEEGGPTLLLRRRGDRVSLSIMGTVGAERRTFSNLIPGGFQPLSNFRSELPLFLPGMVTMVDDSQAPLVGYLAEGKDIVVYPPSGAAGGEPFVASLEWTTGQTWPLSIPGTGIDTGAEDPL